jgi:oxygen-independent coproporphyrinogen III oxidase
MGESAPYSLYIHIPFCGTRCTYCAFVTYTNLETLIPAYTHAVCRELRFLRGDGSNLLSNLLPLHTVFFGGGTPSLLSPDQIGAILDSVRESFHLLPDAEITLEANPGSVDGAYLSALRETGVNRLSLGMQSAHAHELQMFARQHGVEAVSRTVSEARRAGFDSLNLDLIYGVPNQTMSMWRDSLDAALSLSPDHLALYSLQLEEGTPMTKWVQGGNLPAPDDDLAADMYELADERLNAAGLAQYEISNWAIPGKECRHNLQYWRNLPYLGVGVGAHGYANGTRYEIVRTIPRYLELANAQTEPMPFPFTATVEKHTPIDPDAAMSEHMMTGLRLIREGISVSAFEARFGVPIDSVYGEALDRLIGWSLLTRNEDTIRLTPRARLISNQVMAEFF